MDQAPAWTAHPEPHDGPDPGALPLVDPVYETTDEEDAYDEACLVAALAEPSDPVPLEDAMAELGFTWDDLLV